MKALLVSGPRRSPFPGRRRILDEAAGFDLVLLPEAALSPFPDGRDPDLDRRFAEPVPGPATEEYGRVARDRGCFLALGLIEREGESLYDSAVLLDPDGEIALHYRRINPGWFFPDADPTVYGSGERIPFAVTPWGRVAFLICGDLFDDDVLARVPPSDLLLVPFARSLADGDLGAWEREEVPAYAERVARAGVPALLVNRADGEFVGGAMAIEGSGRVAAELPPGCPGALRVGFESPGRFAKLP
jgi:N-carbamoylputrescine amidase